MTEELDKMGMLEPPTLSQKNKSFRDKAWNEWFEELKQYKVGILFFVQYTVIVLLILWCLSYIIQRLSTQTNAGQSYPRTLIRLWVVGQIFSARSTKMALSAKKHKACTLSADQTARPTALGFSFSNPRSKVSKECRDERCSTNDSDSLICEDGKRRKIWHNAQRSRQNGTSIRSGGNANAAWISFYYYYL